jgi:hypothetical protein
MRAGPTTGRDMHIQGRVRSSLITALLPLTFAVIACSHSAPPSAAPPPVMSAAHISGWVTAAVGGHVSGSLTSSGRSAQPTPDAAVPDACASGTYVGALVGGGGASITTGVYAAGAFTIPGGLIPVGKEMIITFTCSDGTHQRCLAKPGDAGISCDPVADAVMAAFEAALAKTVFDTALDGKPVSKIGSAIVQAAQSDTTATQSFNAQIVACKSAADVGACDKDAIRSSPFAGAFQMMATMVNGWSVEALYTLMADVFSLQIQIDSFLYSDFGTHMDKWLSTDFVAQSRAFIAAVVADQLAGGSRYVIKVQCQMWYSKKGSGGQFNYDPTMLTNAAGISQPSCANDAAFAKDGLTPAQISLLDAAIQLQSSGGHGGGGPLDLSASHYGCNNAAVDWNALPSDYFCAEVPSLQFASRFTEPNRNDPDGSHGNDFYNQTSVSLINAFKELQQSLQSPPAGAPSGCVAFSQNGPPNVNVADPACDAWFQTNIMVPNAKNFSGVLGLYLSLKNPAAGGNALLSLKQLHQLFVQDDYLASRLTAQGNGVSGVRITDAPPNSNNWLPALLQVTSAGQLQLSDLFAWTPAKGMGGLTATTAQATAIFAATPVPYAVDFKMFENLPSATDIHDYVYRSAYHSDWNPTGSKLFYAASVQNSSIPIFCKMQDADTGKATERPLDNHVRILCLDSTQIGALVRPDASGSMAMPDGYPYTLQGFGFQGDGKGSLFALADRRTGFTVQAANMPILLYQISAGNAAGECNDARLADTLVTARLNFGWGGSTQNQATPVYCLDTTRLAQPGQVNLYYGGNLSISQTDPYGHTNQWQMPEVGMLDPASGTNTLVPVCLFASSATFTTSAAGKTTSGLATIDASGNVTALGDAVVDACTSVAHASLTSRYNIVMGSSIQTSDRTQLKGHLIGDQRQGYRMLQWETCQDIVCSTNVNWDAMNVSIGPGVMEASLGGAKKVAPAAASAWVMSVNLLNQKWQAKFDPYCDDVDGAGYCKCFIAGTATPRADQTTCSLEDDSAYPTMSGAPYPTQGPQAAAYQSMFKQLGGKSGAQLATIVDAAGLTVPFDGNYIQQNQLWMDWSQAFKCQYKVTGEATYRAPSQFDNMHPYSLHHSGCPDSGGTIVVQSSCTQAGCAVGGGPVRMVNPLPMNNTYAINRPNMLIKMVNYATKSTGQGVTLDPAAPTFSFDEALSLVALRYAMPRLDSKVYLSDGTTQVPGALPFFSQVRLSNGGNDMDLPSAVLRATLHGTTELTAP